LALLTAAAADAQTSHPVQPQGVSHLQSLDFSIVRQQENEVSSPFQHGMLTQKEVGSDSFLGIGLVKMRGRRKDGSDMRAGVDPVVTRNPAVTFVLKF
jgi:hypothetical protein